MRVFKAKWTGARGGKRETARWYVEFRDGDRPHRLPAYTDRQSSVEFGRKIERLASCKAAKLPPDPELMTTLGQSTQYIDTDTTSISRVPNITGPFTNDTPPTPQNSGVPQVPEPATLFVLLQVLGIGTAVGAGRFQRR